MASVVGGSSSSNPRSANLVKYYTRVGSGESHFVWRIEHFLLATTPEFRNNTLEMTVAAGVGGGGGGEDYSVYRQVEFRFTLEHLGPLKSDEQAALDDLRVRRQAAQELLDRAREALRANGNRRRRLPELQIGVQVAEEGLQEVHARIRPLEQRPDSSIIRLVCRFTDAPASANLPLTSKRLQVRVRRRAGDDFYFDSELQPETKIVGGGGGEGRWELPKLIDYSREDIKNLLLVDDALRIEIKLSLAQVCDDDEEEADVTDYELPIASWLPKLILAEELVPADKMTVILGCSGDESQEQVALSSWKAVLSLRSSFLAGQIQRHPAQFNFRLDLSPGTLRLLVRYLHTGELPPGGFSSFSEILDVAVAARKYGLPELFSYCDEILADYCNMDTASYLLCRSREIRLFRSSQVIMDYITSHSSNMRLDIQNPNPVMNAPTVANGAGGGGVEDKAKTTIPETIINHNYSINEIITTGVRKEVYPFAWEIRNFTQLVHSLHPQPATFQKTKITGCSFNSEATKWELSVRGSEKDDGQIKVMLTCKCLSREGEDVLESNVHFHVDVTYVTGSRKKEWCPAQDVKPVPLAKSFSFTYNTREGKSRVVDGTGALYLKLQIVVFSNQQSTRTSNDERGKTFIGACHVHREFRARSAEKLERDMESLYKSLPFFTDVTITSKEGHQFFAHWRVLAFRCAAFKSMFESGMAERQTGIINLDDIPHNAVDIMLYHIYTGRIPVARFATAMDFIDVAHVAEKYDLSGLRRYADDNLVRKCSLTNAAELLSAAALYKLSNATLAIQNFIRSKARNPSEYSDLLAGLCTASAYSLMSN